MSVIRKSILLEGDAKKKIVYYPCPSSEFQNQLTKIAVSSLSFQAESAIDEVCYISCNFVTSERYLNNEVFSYEQPFELFLMKGTKNSINFGVKWFAINKLSQKLSFTLLKQNGQIIAAPKCEIALLVLFQ